MVVADRFGRSSVSNGGMTRTPGARVAGGLLGYAAGGLLTIRWGPTCRPVLVYQLDELADVQQPPTDVGG